MEFTILIDPSFVVITLYIICLKRRKNIAFLLYGHALAQEPCPRDHEIFGWLFLGHHYLKLRLSDLCLGVEKKILKECIFTIWLIWPYLSARSIGHYYYTLSLSEPCSGVEIKRIVLKKIFFYTFYLKITSYWVRGHENNIFLSPNPTDVTKQIWL